MHCSFCYFYCLLQRYWYTKCCPARSVIDIVYYRGIDAPVVALFVLLLILFITEVLMHQVLPWSFCYWYCLLQRNWCTNCCPACSVIDIVYYRLIDASVVALFVLLLILFITEVLIHQVSPCSFCYWYCLLQRHWCTSCCPVRSVIDTV